MPDERYTAALDTRVITAETRRTSIILPILNAGGALVEVLERLAKTVSTDDEVILIDDGSSDDTLEHLVAEGKEFSECLVLTTATNHGVAAARNTALRFARGRTVWFVDWDDGWDPTILEQMHEASARSGADVVVCQAVRRIDGHVEPALIDGSIGGQVISGDDVLAAILQGKLRGYLWSKLIRRDVLGTDDVFPPMKSYSDFCGIVPVLARASVVRIPRVLYFHDERPGSITTSAAPDIQRIIACRDVVEETLATAGSPERLWRAKTEYDLEFFALPIVNLSLRLGASDAVLRERIESIKPMIRWRSLALIAPDRPKLALRAGMLRLFGTAYPRVYRAAIRTRSARRRRSLT